MRRLPMENPNNRWFKTNVDYCEEPPTAELQVYEDHTKTVLSKNDSPDVGFKWSLNPYRGCVHGCAYCYARPTHEYLGFGSGADFERKITAKLRAPQLLRDTFERSSWLGEPIVFSGNTDCYQPLEAQYRLTRGCLEVCAEYRNPVYIITKSALIERDLDVLCELARTARVGVTLSIPFMDATVARAIEPYVPPPARRFATVRKLADAGIKVSVNIAPLIPGLNDSDIISILEASHAAGAQGAGLVMLRLPGSVKEVFIERLREAVPLRAAKVEARIREMRGGMLYDSRFGHRQSGEGEYAKTLEHVFVTTLARLGMRGEKVDVGAVGTTFRRPTDRGGQLRLFG
jgi:DNA repair photolyase